MINKNMLELGRTKSSIKEVMEMEKGSVVELDKIARLKEERVAEAPDCYCTYENMSYQCESYLEQNILYKFLNFEFEDKEQENKHHPNNGAQLSTCDCICPQSCPNSTFFNNLQWRRQRTTTQQNR